LNRKDHRKNGFPGCEWRGRLKRRFLHRAPKIVLLPSQPTMNYICVGFTHGAFMLKYALPLLYSVNSSVVFGMLRRRLGEIIPLNKLLGIEITSVGDGVAEAKLPFRAEVTNHIGSVHATAIFGLAEAASGGAMSGAFAPVMLSVRAVAASANVRFLKIARTDLFARAKLVGVTDELRAELANAGKVVFDVVVDVRDAAGDSIGELTVAWHVTKK
jgi:uncharacterized protein (TIGR00369 family)